MNFEANDMNHMQWFNRLGKILDMERACMVALEAKVSLLNTHTHTHTHTCILRLLRVHAPHLHTRSHTSTPWQVDAAFVADEAKNDIIWDEFIKADEFSAYTKKMLCKMLKKIIKLKPKKRWIVGANADDDIGEMHLLGP